MAIGGRLGRNRLEAFSDGVMAIAITLLILDVRATNVPEGQLGHVLVENWPSYAAYALTFFVIGIMWVNHHYLFDRVGIVTRPLLFLNIFMLMSIAFLPFPTSLLSEYLRESDNGHVAAVAYAINMTVISLSFSLIWFHLSRHEHLLVKGATGADARSALRSGLGGGAVYAATILLAFVSAQACLIVWALLAVYWMVWRGQSPRVSRQAESR
jgi:uncharacterized membrane protein